MRKNTSLGPWALGGGERQMVWGQGFPNSSELLAQIMRKVGNYNAHQVNKNTHVNRGPS